MANLSKVDMEKEAKKHLKAREPLTVLIKGMRDLLADFGEPTNEHLYDGINDFVLETLQSKER